MEQGFVRLEKLDPNIRVSIRYSTKYNFLGERVDGYYSSNAIIISEAAAEAFLNVQNELSREGYNLVFYDAYRPQKAVDHFSRWATNISTKTKGIFYPSLTKEEIFTKGFIAKRSTHTRGSTADVSIIKKEKELFKTPKLVKKTLKNGRIIPFFDDNSVDMGGFFDLFDPVSFYTNREISETQYEMRMYLQSKMVKYGFEPYEKEWWHFTLKNEPFPNKYFNFDVV